MRRGVSTSGGGPKVVGILGGGISGLSCAYYLLKKFGEAQVRPVVFEKQGRVGGWIRSVRTPMGLYEFGPRSVRPAGVVGLNTLDLVQELGLHTGVLYVEKTHPTVKNRLVYTGGELVGLPKDVWGVLKRVKPFKKALAWSGVRDVFVGRKVLEDDSVHGFVSRRFGKDVADYLTDPIIRGICAGDSKSISVQFIMRQLFELEQKYGSVVIGSLIERFKKKPCNLDDEGKSVGGTAIAMSSAVRGWAVWSLRI